MKQKNPGPQGTIGNMGDELSRKGTLISIKEDSGFISLSRQVIANSEQAQMRTQPAQPTGTQSFAVVFGFLVVIN